MDGRGHFLYRADPHGGRGERDSGRLCSPSPLDLAAPGKHAGHAHRCQGNGHAGGVAGQSRAGIHTLDIAHDPLFQAVAAEVGYVRRHRVLVVGAAARSLSGTAPGSKGVGRDPMTRSSPHGFK